MTDFAAPNMTGVGTIGDWAWWNIGSLPISFGNHAPFTIEAWIMPGAPGSNIAVVQKPGEFCLAVVQGVLSVTWGSTSLAGETAISVAAWTHIAVAYDGSNLNLYVGGYLDATMVVSGNGVAPTGSNFAIGNYLAASNPRPNDPCDVWEVAFYDYAKTQDQAAEAPWAAPAPPGLVAHFDFSVIPPRETVAGAAITPAQGALAQTVAPAVNLDGKYGGMVIGQDATLPSIPPQFTVSTWVTWGQDPGVHVLFAAGDPAGNEGSIQLGLDATNPVAAILYVSTPTGTARWVGVGNLGDWHNIAATCDGLVLRLYFDGQAVAVTELSAAPPAVTAPIWTAGFAIVNRQKTFWHTGMMQWLSVWGRCLSPEHVEFQQYGGTAFDEGILLDASLDMVPPTDLAQGIGIALGGTASDTVQRLTPTQWAAPPEQINPPPAVALDVPRFDQVDWPVPFCPAGAAAIGPGSVEDVLDESATYLAKLQPAAAAILQEQLRQSAQAALAQDFAGRAPVRWELDGEEMVWVFVGTGETRIELLRVRSDGITPCQQWWASFVFTLLVGLLGLLFFRFREQDLSDWIQRNILNNRTVLEALAEAWASSPSFTGFTVVKLLAVIYKAGLMRSFLWFAAYQAGYFALLQAVAFVASVAFGATAVVAGVAARCAVLAANLGLQVASYNTACSATSNRSGSG